ncbi:MAG TPA: hypothetical protein PKH93_08505 [Chitinophagales bacterium]|nr:hypothetical protein [Chitinophagales bacterium]
MEKLNNLTAIFDHDVLYQMPDYPEVQGKFDTSASCRIVIAHKIVTPLSAVEADLLEKMMLGIKTRLLSNKTMDYSVQINLHTHPHTLAQMVSLYQPTHFLGFGVTRLDLGLNILAGLYQPIQFLNIWLLFSESLSVLSQAADKKAKLWEGMKIAFGQ